MRNLTDNRLKKEVLGELLRFLLLASPFLALFAAGLAVFYALVGNRVDGIMAALLFVAWAAVAKNRVRIAAALIPPRDEVQRG